MCQGYQFVLLHMARNTWMAISLGIVVPRFHSLLSFRQMALDKDSKVLSVSAFLIVKQKVIFAITDLMEMVDC